MAVPVLKAGARGAQRTGVTKDLAGGALSCSVTLEGPYADLDALSAEEMAAFLPEGYELDRAALASGGDGLARLTAYGAARDAEGEEEQLRTTLRIDMEEVSYDLVDHPDLAGAPRAEAEAWLATDPAARFSGGRYWKAGADGALSEVSSRAALRFCAAYTAGIRTFARYYPVVERQSFWRNPPGMSRSGRSYTGGSPAFSADAGTFADPPVSLSGYPSGNWFKSGDSWTQRGARDWMRAERWTYTPEGSSGPHAWIHGGGAS